MLKTSAAARVFSLCMALLLAAACSEEVPPGKLLERADEALARGGVEAALIDFKIALQQDPGSAAGRALYGDTSRRRQRPANEIREFRHSWQVAKDAGLAEALVLSGALYPALGDIPAARAHLERAQYLEGRIAQLGGYYASVGDDAAAVTLTGACRSHGAVGAVGPRGGPMRVWRHLVETAASRGRQHSYV